MEYETNERSFQKHLVKLRRSFHAEPELAFEEVKTANKIMAELDSLKIPYEYAGKGTGVIGKLICDDAVCKVALRAEMDALPGEESTNLSFASQHKGIVHSCGHDAHMAMVLGAARILKKNPPKANVLFVFQPAEEKGAGSKTILNTGLLDDADAIFAGHVTQHFRLGEVMIAEGVITAQSDYFKITVQGKGGHGARPHEALDAVVIANLLISTIQTLVSREVDPVNPSVITIGKIIAGSAPNVIADTAILEGTIRTTLKSVRAHLHNRIRQLTQFLANFYNTKITAEIIDGYPPVINTALETNMARQAAEKTVGANRIVSMEHPSMGADDFAYYLKKIPGCYVRFGARISEKIYYPLHSPFFDINEKILPIGAKFFAALVSEAIAYHE